MPNEINATVAGLEGLSQMSSFTGWFVTGAVFVGIIGLLFLLSKNIRQFFYGAIVSVVILINYWISRGIGVSASQGDYSSLKTACWVVGFVVVSIIIGRILQMTKFVKNLEEKLTEEKEGDD